MTPNNQLMASGRSIEDIKSELDALYQKETAGLLGLYRGKKTWRTWVDWRLKTELIRQLYSTKQERDALFFTTNIIGYPGERVLNYDSNGSAYFPTLRHEQILNPKDWRDRLPTSNFKKKKWPPILVEDLLTTWQDDCLDCGKGSNHHCRCNYIAWKTRLEEDWMFTFEIQYLGDPPIGYGLFSRDPFNPNEILGEATGQLEPREIHEKQTDDQASYSLSIPIGSTVPRSKKGQKEAVCYINAKYVGNHFRFLMHSCNPNSQFLIGRIGNRRVAAIQALKKIRPGDLITVDYGEDWWMKGKEKCRCGETTCRRSS
ncbi:SET domain-containing protein [Delitschia confertaspora ATCC 74209]|uniref:SET domain-containing protein n=1 Tax=Delitschia confertaspora ATCC 74209 TaxID=1513339 RepID=A0A9P4JT59_9PLEO|nr:SET domain-containing protein [Delitschia confertaspora ATCC 74209]